MTPRESQRWVPPLRSGRRWTLVGRLLLCNPPYPPLLKGGGNTVKLPLLLHRRLLQNSPYSATNNVFVTPAKAGVQQLDFEEPQVKCWIPAFAGMTPAVVLPRFISPLLLGEGAGGEGSAKRPRSAKPEIAASPSAPRNDTKRKSTVGPSAAVGTTLDVGRPPVTLKSPLPPFAKGG